MKELHFLALCLFLFISSGSQSNPDSPISAFFQVREVGALLSLIQLPLLPFMSMNMLQQPLKRAVLMAEVANVRHLMCFK